MNGTSVTETTPVQKAAEVTYMIVNGETFTTAEIAERYNMSWSGADRLLNKISGKVPICKEESKWRKV